MQTVSGILCSVFNKGFPQCNSCANTTLQKAKLSMNYLFGKCKLTCSFLWIFSCSLDKFLIENSVFCTV